MTLNAQNVNISQLSEISDEAQQHLNAQSLSDSEATDLAHDVLLYNNDLADLKEKLSNAQTNQASATDAFAAFADTHLTFKQSFDAWRSKQEPSVILDEAQTRLNTTGVEIFRAAAAIDDPKMAKSLRDQYQGESGEPIPTLERAQPVPETDVYRGPSKHVDLPTLPPAERWVRTRLLQLRKLFRRMIGKPFESPPASIDDGGTDAGKKVRRARSAFFFRRKGREVAATHPNPSAPVILTPQQRQPSQPRAAEASARNTPPRTPTPEAAPGHSHSPPVSKQTKTVHRQSP